MALNANNTRRPRSPCNIVFFGETGSGKSSIINLLLEPGTSRAPVSGDSQPCTQDNVCYSAILENRQYNLWDTRGLGEGRNFLRALFRVGSEKALKKFLKERYQAHEIDLLVYCVHQPRVTKALEKYYGIFCANTRRLVAPIVIVVTRLEKEEDMEDWWKRNSSDLEAFNMRFDGHACITSVPDPNRPGLLAESKNRLSDLITKDYLPRAEHSEPYFGLVRQSSPSTPLRRERGMVWSMFKGRQRTTVQGRSLSPRPRNDSDPSTVASSAARSEYHTPAESPAELVPPSTVIVPRAPVDPSPLGVSNRPQSPSEDTSSMGSLSQLTFSTGPHSSHTSHSDGLLHVFIEGIDGVRFNYPPATVKKKHAYATISGAFGDVWECDLVSEPGFPRTVAVKVVKNNNSDLESTKDKLRRELKIWARLRHKNVVPLLGVVSDFGPLPSMVSPWFSNRSLTSYLTVHQMLTSPEKDRLLGDIAAGLCYVHSQDVIHGDLHSGNVLIDESGTACLTDFGLSLVKDCAGTSYSSSGFGGRMRFADPALVQRVSNRRGVVHVTKPCDIYSFGGLMLHVLSGKKPYDGSNSASIIWMALKGDRPEIPTGNPGISSWHESVIRKCWDSDENSRPSADTLAMMFGG